MSPPDGGSGRDPREDEPPAEREARRASFDRQAQRYDRARPSYPASIVDGVIARAPGPRALEIGPGPGKATRLFAERGLTITALEPGASLAAMLRRNVPSADVREVRFEDFDETDFDLVYAAQAFHWVDKDVRCAKAAAAGEVLAILTNEKAPLDPELRAELDEVYARFFPSAYPVVGVAGTRALWLEELERSGCFGPVEVLEEPWDETYTTDEYIELLSTYSDHAVHPEADRLYDAIRAIVDRRDGRIAIPYVTLAFVAVRTADRRGHR